MYVALGEIACWFGDPGNRGMDPITAIIFSCSVIHFPAVYKLQRHQRRFVPCLLSCGRF